MATACLNSHYLQVLSAGICWFALVVPYLPTLSQPNSPLFDHKAVVSLQLLPPSLCHTHHVCGGGTVCLGAVASATALVINMQLPVTRSTVLCMPKHQPVSGEDACVRFVREELERPRPSLRSLYSD